MRVEIVGGRYDGYDFEDDAFDPDTQQTYEIAHLALNEQGADTLIWIMTYRLDRVEGDGRERRAIFTFAGSQPLDPAWRAAQQPSQPVTTPASPPS